jgi:spoIIIJ-associated protein
MRSVEAEGSTIDQAIARALELLRIERDKVDIEILENAPRSMLGFGGRTARVRATVRTPLRMLADEAVPEFPVSQETGRDLGTATSLESSPMTAARRAFDEILRHLGVEARVEAAADGDGSWRLAIAGEGAGIVIGRHGQTLDAIEYLLNRIASQGGSGSSSRIVVDVEGYRARREESLQQAARRAAEKVRDTGRPVTLSPMSPRDRRTVHLALSDMRDVSTRSEGEGAVRRVVILPTGRSRQNLAR